MKNILNKFFCFQGRLNRKRYFCRYLALISFFILAGMSIGFVAALCPKLVYSVTSIDVNFDVDTSTEIFIAGVVLALYPIILISGCYLDMRRLHDLNISGKWAYLIVFYEIFLTVGTNYFQSGLSQYLSYHSFGSLVCILLLCLAQ